MPFAWELSCCPRRQLPWKLSLPDVATASSDFPSGLEWQHKRCTRRTSAGKYWCVPSLWITSELSGTLRAWKLCSPDLLAGWGMRTSSPPLLVPSSFQSISEFLKRKMGVGYAVMTVNWCRSFKCRQQPSHVPHAKGERVTARNVLPEPQLGIGELV